MIEAIKILSLVALISLVLLSVALAIFEEKKRERLINIIFLLTGTSLGFMLSLGISVVCVFRYLG